MLAKYRIIQVVSSFYNLCYPTNSIKLTLIDDRQQAIRMAYISYFLLRAATKLAARTYLPTYRIYLPNHSSYSKHQALSQPSS